MYWTIAFYTFLGWLIFHLRSIKRFNESTPQLTFTESLSAYFKRDIAGFIISVIALILVINFLSLGMAQWILTTFLQIPIDVQNDNQVRLIGAFFGVNIELVVSAFTKTKKDNEPKP